MTCNTYVLNPYSTNLVIGIDNDPQKLCTALNLNNPGINIDWTREHAAAITYERFFKKKGKKHKSHYIVVIFTADFADVETMTHEAVHVVNYIFDHVGVHLDPNNDEAQAYLTGFVAGCMDATVKEFKAKKPKKRK